MSRSTWCCNAARSSQTPCNSISPAETRASSLKMTSSGDLLTDEEVSLEVDSLQWHHNGHDDVSNHQPLQCLLSHLLGRRSNKTSKLRVTGLCAGNSPGTGEFPAQMASNAENGSIRWRHYVWGHHPMPACPLGLCHTTCYHPYYVWPQHPI